MLVSEQVQKYRIKNVIKYWWIDVCSWVKNQDQEYIDLSRKPNMINQISRSQYNHVACSGNSLAIYMKIRRKLCWYAFGSCNKEICCEIAKKCLILSCTLMSFSASYTTESKVGIKTIFEINKNCYIYYQTIGKTILNHKNHKYLLKKFLYEESILLLKKKREKNLTLVYVFVSVYSL